MFRISAELVLASAGAGDGDGSVGAETLAVED